MKKIPTLFQRDESRRYVTNEVTPGCEWVLAGEGIATRKYDGTCAMLDEAGNWWARREVKAGKPAPEGFLFEGYDATTGKTVGWEPIEQSGYARWHAEAVWIDDPHIPGTYELCGPKIQGNPEGYDEHRLIRHAEAERYGSTDPASIVAILQDLRRRGWEGIVWHHPDGRMAKLKARDYPTNKESN